jgi:cytochrome P450
MGLLAGSSENLLSSDGSEWARWRRIFNPGFSTSHLTTFVPRIIEETKVFCRTLEKHAKDNDVFRLEEVLTKLSIDVIGQLIL